MRGAACCCARIDSSALGAPRIASDFEKASDPPAPAGMACADALAGTIASAAAATERASDEREKRRVTMRLRVAEQGEDMLTRDG